MNIFINWPLRAKLAIFLIDYKLASQLFAYPIADQSFKFEDEKSDLCFARVMDGEKSKCGWGSQKFIPHSVIPNYLKNDCLHFKLSLSML